MCDFEGLKSSVQDGAADVLKIAELELQVEPEDMTDWLQPHDKMCMNEELLLMDKQRNWFLEMESTGEDAVKKVEITKDLEERMNLADKLPQGLRGLTPIWKEFLLCVKCVKLPVTEDLFLKGRENPVTNFTVVLC